MKKDIDGLTLNERYEIMIEVYDDILLLQKALDHMFKKIEMVKNLMENGIQKHNNFQSNIPQKSNVIPINNYKLS